MIYRKLLLLTALMIAATTPKAGAQQPTPHYEIAGRDTTCRIFLYSPEPTKGVHAAYLTGKGTWQDMGQLCASDYGPWGKEKKMYDPYVLHAQDGTWRLLFAVNSYAPCFGAAYSDDLVTWRPQDFPRMKERGVLSPLSTQKDAENIGIYFKTNDGSTHYVLASNDFRHFSESGTTAGTVGWLRDSATIDGRRYPGNAFNVSKKQYDRLANHFINTANEAKENSESLRDDKRRFGHTTATVKAVLDVDMQKRKKISDHMMGVFFEDISYAADGGLYAELVQNRDFEYSKEDHRGWTATTAWTSNKPVVIDSCNPISKNTPHYAVIARRDTLYNVGWGGISAAPMQKYDFSVFARNAEGGNNVLQVALIGDDGTVTAKGRIKLKGHVWQRYSLPLAVDSKATRQNVRLALTTLKDGCIDVDMVSLFPNDTFKGHGLRKDLAQAVADLHPKFVRFPGGCMSHGQGIGNIYHWQESIGPWQDRKPAKNIWSYHQTRGLGFYEFFQFCEDIGAEPLPVLAAGVPCQNSAADSDGYAGQQGGIDMKDMPAYCQEILHLIEWANGDTATSEWARMRARAGHPKPFNLKYIGIGNEDLISTAFEERYGMICKAVKDKFPEITVCGTVGPFHNPSSDYIEGWKFANAHKDIIDMVDEHYYESPGWFLHHQDYYDGYDRRGPKVYLGEWASRGSRVENALVEAIHLCNLERNGDIVDMASYAPLFCKEGHSNWNPDLIYFNNDSITRLTPSYYTQKLWGTTAGNEYIYSRLQIADSLRYRVAASIVGKLSADDESAGITPGNEAAKQPVGQLWLKLVNALPYHLEIAVNGLAIPNGTECYGFTGAPNDSQVEPYRSSIKGSALSLPPYSVVIVPLNGYNSK